MNNTYLDFYVYAYLREDGSPYYIGKGRADRAWRKGPKEIKPPKDFSNIVLVSKNLTELWAFALERRLICWYGRKDLGTGILRNKSEGGEGSCGYKHSAEALEKIKLSSIGRKIKHTDVTKQRLRDINLGKKRSIESIKKTADGCRGKKRSPQQIENIKKASVGKNKGKKQSPEHKAKILATKLARGLIKTSVVF
jgi:hypothetical protein